MATREELQQLHQHWNLVVTHIRPRVSQIPKGSGDPDKGDVTDLLSTWQDRVQPVGTPMPSETELLASLHEILVELETEKQAEQTRQNTLKQFVSSDVDELVGKNFADWTLPNLRDVLAVWMFQQGIIDNSGNLKHPRNWDMEISIE